MLDILFLRRQVTQSYFEEFMIMGFLLRIQGIQMNSFILQPEYHYA